MRMANLQVRSIPFLRLVLIKLERVLDFVVEKLLVVLREFLVQYASDVVQNTNGLSRIIKGLVRHDTRFV